MQRTGLDRMRRPDAIPPATRGLGWLALGYAVVMLYASTVIGPGGVNFVAADPGAVFLRFLDTPYVVHGSDQRADWIGNLLMLVPFGFLLAGSFWPRRGRWVPVAVGLALLVGVATILAVKYLQLFFPPRTVTLNYIVAQSLGVAIGCAAYAVWHQRLAGAFRRRDRVAGLVLALRLYTLALAVFVLMPLDFALSADDLAMQFERLPNVVAALPGEGRPLAIRVLLIGAGAAAFIPVGMGLVFVRSGVYRVRRGLLSVTCRGLALTGGLFVLSALVIGATPILASILYRTAGVVVGAAVMRWLVARDTVRLRVGLARAVPWLIVPYLLGLLLVNGLLSSHWRSPREAIDGAYRLGLLPLFDYYIVSKAAAAKNIAGHVLLYMPVGAGVWLLAPRQPAVLAFLLAAILSFGVEVGRYLHPGLEGDVNAVVLAGLAALFTAWLMPGFWSMLTTLASQSRRFGVRPVSRDDPPLVVGEVEEF